MSSKNKQHLYRVGGLWFPVEIIGQRRVYGRTESLIVPVGGTGKRWARDDMMKTSRSRKERKA